MLFYWKNCNFAPMEAKQINKMIKRLLVAGRLVLTIVLFLMGQQTAFAVINPSDTTEVKPVKSDTTEVKTAKADTTEVKKKNMNVVKTQPSPTIPTPIIRL